MRAPRRRSRPRSFPRFRALTALVLLLGIAAPLAPVVPVAATTAAQRGGNPPPLPAPSRVVAVGSFQTAVGCPADYDPSCGLTELADAGGGSWSGVFAVPPGVYGVRVVASGAAGDLSLGAGGDPDAGDVSLQVGPDAAGAYVAYDAVSGQIVAEPVGQPATLVTDLGDRVAMAPARGGGYEAYFDAQPGGYGFQILFGAEPVGQDTISLDAPRRVYVAVDAQGTVVGLDTVRGTVLSVTKVDAAGTPLPGACFAVLTGGEGLVGQGCDGDDGEDGSTRLRVPNGLAPDLYALREVATPDGQEPAEPQRIELGPGEFAAEAVAAGGGEEPGAEPAAETPVAEDEATAEPDGEETPGGGVDAPVAGRVLLRSVDENDEPLPGACFVLVELGIEACDDDADGDVVFENVPPGIFTVSESAAPEGFLANADATIDVGPEGARARVPHQPADDQPADGGIVPVVPNGGATETAEPEPTEPVVAVDGSLVLSVRDEEGGAVTGACFALAPRAGGDPIERCDDADGADDGELLFARVAAGRYRLEETRTPDGREPVALEEVAIGEGEAATLTVTSPAGVAEREAAGPGRLVLLVVDEAGDPLGGSCFDLTGPAVFPGVCDQGNDGRLNVPEIPSGEYAVRQVQTAPGYEPAADETVTVPAGDTEELTVVNRQTAAQRQAEAAGAVAIAATDAAGDPAAGGCYALSGGEAGPIEVCDDGPGDADGDPGAVRIEDVAPGDYEVTESRAPAGGEPSAEVAAVTVTGGETARVRFAAEAPEVVPTEEPAATEETDDAAIQATGTGRLLVRALDENGDAVDGSCVGLVGPSPVDRVCDQEAGDADGDAGSILLADLLPGGYVLQVVAEDDAVPVTNRPLQVQAGTTERVEVVLAADATETPEPAETPEAEPGTLVMVAQDEAGRLLGGACYTVENGGQSFGPFCDENANGDVIVTNVTPGEQSVTQTTAPADADPPEDAEQTADLASGAETTVTFVHAEETAALRVVVRDEGGDPAAGGCYEALGPETYAVCDDGPGDGDPAPGVVLFEDVEPGDYALTEARPATGFAPVEGDQEVTVEAGDPTTVELTVGEAPALGAVLVVMEADGQPLAGACVELSGPATIGPVCDDGVAQTGVRAWSIPAAQAETFVDGDPRGGFVLIEDVPAGDYALTMTNLPTELQTPAAETVTVRAGQTAEVDLTPTAALGTLVILVVDQEGDPLGETCFDLVGPADFVDVCDQGNDGRLNIPEIPAGDYAVRQTRTAPDHDLADEETVTVPAGGSEELTVVNQRQAEPTPEPTATAEPTAEPTAEAEPTGLPNVGVGSIEIESVDPDGARIEATPGACFAVTGAGGLTELCDNEDGDNDPALGVVRLDGLAPAVYQIDQQRAPAGYAVADPAAAVATVEVVAGEAQSVAATSEPVAAVGTLTVVNVGPDGEIVGGGCFSLAGPEDAVCDNGPEDGDPDPGEIAFVGIPAGAYTVTQTAAADGFGVAAAQAVEVVADDEAVVELVSEAAEEETGSVRLEAFDAEGAPVEGRCFRLSRGGERLGPFCDQGDEDAEPEPGILVLQNLRAGAYEAAPEPVAGEEETAEDAATGQTIGGAEQRTFTVRGNQAPVRVVVIVRRQPARDGDLVVSLRDELDRPLAGACFALFQDGGAVSEICDDRGGDGDGNRGQLRFDAVRNGGYLLSETQAPAGYQAAADREVEIVGGRVRRETIANQPVPQTTGGLAVLTVAEGGGGLPGACYTLVRGTGAIGPVCDGNDGDDGQTSFADIDAGAYVLRQTTAPSADYAPASDRALLVAAGETLEVEVANRARPGRLLITTLDEAGELLGGACFAVIPDGAAEAGYELCDDDASDGEKTPGTVLLQGVAPGDYLARQTRAAAGYRTATDQAATVAPNRRVDLVFQDDPIPPPPRRGNLTVYKVDQEGILLAGACFALLQGEATIAGPRCDGADGTNDGTIRFEGVGVGDYALRETVRPAGYQPVEDLAVSVGLDQTREVVVENRLQPGRIAVRKTDGDGDPLRDACFELAPGDDDGCTDGDGLLTFDGLEPGTYALTETDAPPGFLGAAPVEGIVVNPGATTTVDVVNELAPPPPDTGSIQIFKYYCPAGDAGEGTEFVDSSDAGGGRLARTAGCTLGDAGFSLVADSGEGGLGEFGTGPDGRYQAALTAGDYTLTELVPDLPGESTEAVSIFVNQLTTVVVLNFVEPPAPEPAAIDIVKYTCAPGSQGTVFADFAEFCTDPAGLTNNVTFRLSGAERARAVTGDNGRQGETSFEDLAVGRYTLREEPSAANLTVYAFCGLDPNAPDLRAVGPSINLRLEAGQRLTCFWFDVPDRVSETTGSIVVQKYGCAVERAPAGFDWYGECDSQGAGARFSLAVADGTDAQPFDVQPTDRDGLVRFTGLDPGTYALKEVGGAWCHAESDSVDARGNVVVRVGQRSNVFIFNCLGTKRPPNTGAGPLAAAGGAAAGATGMGTALGLAWPLVGLAAWAARRRRWAA